MFIQRYSHKIRSLDIYIQDFNDMQRQKQGAPNISFNLASSTHSEVGETFVTGKPTLSYQSKALNNGEDFTIIS